MVQISSSWILVLAIVASGFASPTFKESLSQVEADITAINAGVDTLDGGIATFKDSLKDALAIHQVAQALAKSVGQGASDISASGRFSESDSGTVVATVQPLGQKIVDTLHAIVDKKAAFKALPVGGIPELIEMDLKLLNSETTAFERALSNAVSADEVSKVKDIQAAIDKAFGQAIAAYA